MGTLEQATAKLKFDGTPKAWPAFKEAMLKMADAQGFVYMLEGRHGLCAIFQAANAAAAKKKSSTKGTISLDITSYKEDEITAELETTSVPTSVWGFRCLLVLV